MKQLLKICLLAAGLSLSAFAEGAVAGATEQRAATRPTLEVVFVLDTTSSMTGLIEGAKEKIWSIASRMASGRPTPRIRVGLVAFRDVGDEYVTKRFDLSEDLDAVYANLRGFQAEGGGDGPEHVGRGLGEAVKLMSWSTGSKTAKMIFLTGDATSHEYNDGWSAKTWAKAAIAKGIVVNLIQCGNQPGTGAEFQALAKLADGSFIAIGQSGGMVATVTPFDEEIGKLNGAVVGTALIAGSAPARSEGAVANAKLAELKPSVASDRIAYKRAKSESFGYAPAPGSGSVDLTEAPAKLIVMKDEELPEVMRSMKPEARAALVKESSEKKKALNAQLAELSAKRTSWLTENAKKASSAGSFDEQVFESVKTRAATVSVRY